MKVFLKVIVGLLFGVFALMLIPIVIAALFIGTSLIKGLLVLFIVGVALYEIGSLLFGSKDSIFTIIDKEL